MAIDSDQRSGQSGGFNAKQEFHQHEPTLESYLKTRLMLIEARDKRGMRNFTAVIGTERISLPIDEAIKAYDLLISQKIGDLPPKT